MPHTKKTPEAIKTLVNGVADLIRKENREVKKGKLYTDSKHRLYAVVAIQGKHAVMQEQKEAWTSEFKVRLDTFDKKYTSAKLSPSPERVMS